MNNNFQLRIQTFFNFWRKRYAYINNLDLAEHRYEANVLLWGSLDALSNRWAQSIASAKHGKSGSRVIFDAFLASYGGVVFALVSLPHVWYRVKENEASRLPADVSVFLGVIGGREATYSLYNYDDNLGIEARATRSVSQDLSLDDIVNQTLASCPGAIQSELENWLTLSRYGSIAYKQLRSSYIHEGQPGAKTHDFKLFRWDKQPTYLSSVYTAPPVMGFSVEFMLGVLNCCINEFEAEALRLQVDPAP